VYVSERTNKAFCYNVETRASQWTDPVKEPEPPLVLQPDQRAAAERVTGVVEFVLQSFDKDKGTGLVMSTPFQAGTVVCFDVRDVHRDDVHLLPEVSVSSVSMRSPVASKFQHYASATGHENTCFSGFNFHTPP